jgi:poly-gamma-glutamate capsule biosynthesis protein CapA/YwtB (metallophosphatase superfamily)
MYVADHVGRDFRACGACCALGRAVINISVALSAVLQCHAAEATSEDAWPGKDIHYRMHPANAPCLRAAAIDCCVLANNHVLDWGYPGLRETLV